MSIDCFVVVGTFGLLPSVFDVVHAETENTDNMRTPAVQRNTGVLC